MARDGQPGAPRGGAPRTRLTLPFPLSSRLAPTALLVVLLAAGPAAAQHALVLSGGGARGLAHAGAIVALEESGYRPSLVVGTSMGAIVGALYAAGYTADEVRALIAGENWLEQMSAAAAVVGPRRDARRPLLGFGIGRGRSYGGFLSAPGIDQRLIELLFDAGVRARNDFDRLPIRYRAVAADLATGAEVVLDSGDLPRAVRASMAVPGAFAPVHWNGRVLVDGGVANNLAVSVARSLSDAPVIAIDVLRPRVPVEERSALDLAVRSLRLLIENARPASEPDILVLPPIRPGYSESSFPTDASDILERGYRAVLDQVRPVERQPEARREPGPPPARIGRLVVEGAHPAEDRLIRRIMRGAVREYDPSDIVERTAALYRTGLFQAVWPRLEFGDSAGPTLVVDVTPVTRTSLIGGARWDNDRGGRAWFALRQGANLNRPLELQLAGTIDQLGHAGSIGLSTFSTLVPGMVWTGGAHAAEQRLRVIDGASVVDQPRARRAGGWAGAELSGSVPNWLFSTLILAEHVRMVSVAEGWTVGPLVRIARKPAPDRATGVDPLLEGEVRGGGIEYQRARVRLSHSWTMGRLLAGALLEAAASGNAAPTDALPVLDRDIAPWLPAGTTPHRALAAAGADAALPIALNGHARIRLRALALAPDLAALGDRAAWRLGGEVGAIWPTILGPIAVGVAIGQRTSWQLNVSVGSTF